jgi:hypothetical protein
VRFRMNSRSFINMLNVVLFFILPALLFAQSAWIEDSFEDFRDGTFLDAGSNLYVSAKGRIQMITRWDLNNDGHLDIVLPDGHTHTEKENVFIYLNDGSQIDGRNRIELPAGGSRGGTVADFNKDGFNDLAIANASDSHFSRVNSWIWYGSEQGFSVENRIALPAFRGRDIVAGDFNNDSWLDIAIACNWQAGTIVEPEGPQMSFIYWNSPDGFNEKNRFPLVFEEKGANALASTDLDNDGIDDLILLAAGKTYILLSGEDAFNNPDNRKILDLSGNALALGKFNNDMYYDLAVSGSKSLIFVPGIKNSFDLQSKIELKVSNPVDVVFADINKDQLDDIIVANNSTPGGATWTDSYIFLSDDGTISETKHIKLPTFGATGVSAKDLNQDGYPDLVFSNQRITHQLDLNSYIYWNDSGKFYFGNHSQLPTLGTVGNIIGDVNNDDLPDVIFLNEEGYFRDGPAKTHIYWGDGKRNFSENRRKSFNTHHIFGEGHADLDDDGYVDLVLSQERFMYRIPHEQNGLILYWGTKNDFSTPSYLTMSTAYGGVRIADINKDGYLDLLAGGAAIDLTDPSKHGIPIFWGSAKGYSLQNRSIIHHEIEKMRAPLLMDLNKDNWLDIAGQVEDGKIRIWWGSENGFDDLTFQEIDLGRKDHLMYIKGADLNQDGWLDLFLPKRRPHQNYNTSFVYYGSSDGFSNDNRIEIEANIPYENSIADFNKDGWLDIFISSYGTDLTGNRPSLIHWGTPEGFNKLKPKELKTHGGSGSEVLDYDGDGWLDILVANHRKAGSINEPIPHEHTTPTQLFWGGPDGYSDENTWEVIAGGPSGLNLRDPGNSYNRQLYEDYISSVHEISGNVSPDRLSWTAQTPHGSEIKFQIRVADSRDKIVEAKWQGSDGEDSWFVKNDTDVNIQTEKFIQYRARLISPNGGSSPVLEKVVVSFK